MLPGICFNYRDETGLPEEVFRGSLEISGAPWLIMASIGSAAAHGVDENFIFGSLSYNIGQPA